MSATAADVRGAGVLKIPPFGLAAALMLWGMATQVLLYAVAMAAVLELARWSPWRWQLSDKDFERLSDATGLGFLVVVFYAFDTYSFQGVYTILQWLPFVLFLLATAQRFATRGSIRYSALFLSVRRAERKGTIEDAGAIDFDLPYLVVCLVSATGSEMRGLQLFAGLAGVLVFVLWYNRPRHFRFGVWMAVCALAIGIGYLNQLGMLKLRRVIEPVVMDFFRERMMNYRNPFRSYTALGHIGRLKQSDRIVLRVTDLDGGGVPSLLREATYRHFSKNIWLAGSSAFQEQLPDIEGLTWTLESHPVDESRTVRVARHLRRGRGLLPVPRGTFQIENLPVEELQRHPLGALQVQKGPGLVRYIARYAPGRDFELPPGEADLLVPRELGALMTRVIAELNLNDASPGEALDILNEYFRTQFRYSVVLRRPQPMATPLHEFLLKTRTGHCEFFASATVLLLRALGIPARYATGYSIQEYSPLEKSFLVRRRHAHSWALAYVDGGWVDVDTTPSTWVAMEAEAAPWWEDTYDVASWLMFQYSRWRWSGDEDDASGELVWLVIPLFALLLWRLARAGRVSRKPRGARRRRRGRAPPGVDSELYPLLEVLEKRGHPRAPGEPLGRWLATLAKGEGAEAIGEVLTEMLPVHYRYRFDPEGISAAERAALGRRVRAWLARHAA